MKSVIKRMTVVCMAFVMMLSMMPLLGAVTNGAAGAQAAYADAPEDDVTVDGVTYHLWIGETGASVALRDAYTGTATKLKLAESVTYNGKTYTADGETSWFFIDGKGEDGKGKSWPGAFVGNTTITEIAIPDKYVGISTGAFTGCTNLKTYYIKGEGEGAISAESIKGAGIGTDADGNPIAGVTVWTKQGSNVDTAIQELNDGRPADKQITLIYDDDPYNKIVTDDPGSGGGGDTPSGGGTNPPANDGSAAAIEKTILATGGEKDVKGSTFSLLQARAKKVGKTSVTLGWSKPKGAKSYVVYGNTCSKKHKYVKLATTGKNSIPVKKILKNKVKKGTYYKFIIVALDANGNVVATSKTVHAATTGGKVGNDKAVNTAAKKNKVSLKKGKSFKLKAKAVAASKKLKVKKHRGVAYESSDPAVATVSSKGVIKGKKKGSCYVYAYAQNGVFRKIKVTIK